MTDSGSAVPTAASSAPTAPWPRSRRLPEPLHRVREADRPADDQDEGGEQLERRSPGGPPRDGGRPTRDSASVR